MRWSGGARGTHSRNCAQTASDPCLDCIDAAKPPDRTGGALHYLLYTPFRYPPLRHGSRFGRRTEPEIWYGSETPRAAFAEVAYYRLVFLEGTAAELGTVETPLTSFRADVRADRGIDLAVPPFAAHTSAIASPDSYTESQALGGAMREAGVEAFRYGCARDDEGGINVGVFDPAVFGRRRPRDLRSWHCTATGERVEVRSRGYFAREVFAYPREQFLVDGRLPAPAV